MNKYNQDEFTNESRGSKDFEEKSTYPKFQELTTSAASIFAPIPINSLSILGPLFVLSELHASCIHPVARGVVDNSEIGNSEKSVKFILFEGLVIVWGRGTITS